MNSGKLVCFMCDWVFCNRTESTILSEHRLPFDVKIVQVKCVGRIDPVVVLETFRNGVEAILIVGCAPPDCHFVKGNLYAQYIVKSLKKLLAAAGLEAQRLEICWLSPDEREKLGQIIVDFAGQIERLGPSPLAAGSPDSEAMFNMLVAKKVASGFRLRILIGREEEITENSNVYREKVSQEEHEAIIDEVIEAEFIRQKIHLLTKTKPLSVKELASINQMEPASVLRQIVDMRRKGMIALDSVKETTPLYKALEVKGNG